MKLSAARSRAATFATAAFDTPDEVRNCRIVSSFASNVERLLMAEQRRTIEREIASEITHDLRATVANCRKRRASARDTTGVGSSLDADAAALSRRNSAHSLATASRSLSDVIM